MRKTRGGSSRYFYAFGGPADGELVRVKPGATTFMKIDPTHVQGVRYSYVLVATRSGKQAFVPEDDGCLREAVLAADREPAGPRDETLAAEMERRGLKL